MHEAARNPREVKVAYAGGPTLRGEVQHEKEPMKEDPIMDTV